MSLNYVLYASVIIVSHVILPQTSNTCGTTAAATTGVGAGCEAPTAPNKVCLCSQGARQGGAGPVHEYLGTRDVLSAYERKRNRDRESEVIPLRKGMCVLYWLAQRVIHIHWRMNQWSRDAKRPYSSPMALNIFLGEKERTRLSFVLLCPLPISLATLRSRKSVNNSELTSDRCLMQLLWRPRVSSDIWTYHHWRDRSTWLSCLQTSGCSWSYAFAYVYIYVVGIACVCLCINWYMYALITTLYEREKRDDMTKLFNYVKFN